MMTPLQHNLATPRRFRIASAAAAALFLAAPLSAQTFTFNGGSAAAGGTPTNPLWSDSFNWFSAAPPAGGGSTIDLEFGAAFPGYPPPNTVNDLGTFSLDDLTFFAGGSLPGATPYNLLGSALNFSGPDPLISNNSGLTQVITNEVFLSNETTFIANAGNLGFASPAIQGNAVKLNVTGASNTTILGNVGLNGLQKAGLGDLTFQNNNVNSVDLFDPLIVQSGRVIVTGADTDLTVDGGDVTVDNFGGVSAELLVANGATFTTVNNSDETNINPNGTLTFDNATYNASGDVSVNGGTFSVTNGGQFNLGAGRTLTASNDGQVDFSDSYTINNGTTVAIQSGADLMAPSISLGVGGDGTLTVDGFGSTVTASTSAANWGLSGNTADVTFRNGAQGALGEVRLANSTNISTETNLNIESGADVTTGNLQIVANASGLATGTITVDGAGSTLVQNGASTLSVGGSNPSGSATINVQNGGAFTTGTGATTIDANGTVNVGLVGAGTLNVNGSLDVDGGALNFGAGDAFVFNNGDTLSATNSAQLNFGDDVSIANASSVNVLSGSDMIVSGELQVDNGIMDVNNSTMTASGDVFVQNGAQWNIQNGADVTTSGLVRIGATSGISGGTTAVVDISGTGTTFENLGTDFVAVGGSGQSGQLIVRDSAQATIAGRLGVVASNSSNPVGDVDILSGGDVEVAGNLDILTGTNPAGSNTQMATLDIDGLGSALKVDGDINFGIGGGHDQTGVVTVSDSGLLFQVGAGDFNIGGAPEPTNSATLNINGGVVTTGAGTTIVGATGVINLNSGALNVSGLDNTAGGALNFNDGRLTVDGGVFAPNTGGVYNVDGPTAVELPRLELFNATANLGDDLRVGDNHRGRLTISGVATLSSEDGILGRLNNSQGFVIVDGSGSTWTNTGTLTVGNVGNGTLEITQGGAVSNTTASIAVNPSSTSSATVQEMSTWTNTADLFVGGSSTGAGGTGTLNVASGGLVEVAGELKVWGPGTVRLSSDITLGGGMVTTDSFAIAGGRVEGVGTIIATSGLTNSGAVAPGESSGILTIAGDYEQTSAGSLEIEIGGELAGEFDLLDISGDATLDGALDVQLIDGFTPSPGDSFEVLTAASVSGTFAAESLPALIGLAWNVDYGATSMVLGIGIAGDYNNDLVVDSVDYVVWRDNLGAAAGTLPNDADGGVIGQAQYDAWAANYGATPASFATAQSVPEPSALLLTLLTIAGASRRFR